MIVRLSFILILVLCYSTKSLAQVSLDYEDELLNEILLDLNDRYQVQISVNAELSNACAITIRQTFRSMDLAMQALADQCKLELRKIGEVYTFRTLSKSEEPVIAKQKPTYLYQGVVREIDSDEVLPFAVVSTSDRNLVTDEEGRFSFKSSTDQEVLLFRSLGYQDSDTTLSPGNGLNIRLKPRPMELEDVIVLAEEVDIAITNVGDGAGHVQLNNINNRLIPGLSNNLIFNNLRLYPGIMAAGESIADFVIWGSYAGQNHVIYDGISLFNSWGINDDMGRVNPFMIKHVEVYKGGYNVPYGDRIGGVVLIDGKSGNPNAVESSVSLTNQLVSAYLNIPMFNKTSSLQLAGRKAFTDPFKLSSEFEDDINLIVPKYDYSDLHLKFSTQLSNNEQLEFSSVISSDSYKGRFRAGNSLRVVRDVNINSEQVGSSLKYTRNWTYGGLTSIVLSRSHYKPELTNNFFVVANAFDREFDPRTQIWNNPILEYRTQLTHRFPVANNHQLQMNLEYVSNKVSFEASGPDRFIANTVNQEDRISAYVFDDVQLTDEFSLQLGLKADAPESHDKTYWQPRINAQFDLSEKWNVHLGWGHYSQFISKNEVTDTLGNRTDLWQVSNGGSIPVFTSVHNVIGFGYQTDGFELSVEAFYKTSEGFARYIVRRAGTFLAEGNARSQGVDFFVRKQLNKHEIWMSYSLAKAEEKLDVGLFTTGYRLAPQSQTHELKAAGVFNFHPIRLSIANVYGSGFADSFSNREEDPIPYWRTDIALSYQFQSVEAGFSVLNLFNRRNVRLNQSVNVPGGARINTAGIPFTPTVYLNVTF